MNFYGRETLLEQLSALWRRQQASLVTCRGRRRIGKSTLIEQFAKLDQAELWAFEGLAPQPKMGNQDQLNAFCRQLAELSGQAYEPVESWFDAFRKLASAVPQRGRCVILLDEISWMGKYDPNFPGELKYAWDRRFHRRKDLIVVICGSVSSWIEHNILANTGFVGRISLDVVVPELTLREAAEFWGARRSRVATREILDVLSVTGGVPRYLEEVAPSQSADENISRMCFRPNGYLFRDFDDIFSTVFAANSSLKRNVLEVLASGSLDGTALAERLGTARNGQFSDMMDELEMAGFVAADSGLNPESGRRMRTIRYRLRDNYSRFYLKYVKPHMREIAEGRYEFVSLENLPEWNAVMGLQFENLILNNFKMLLRPLHLENVQVFSAAPFRKLGKDSTRGVQIDLLVQTRRALIVVEIKRKNGIGEEVERDVMEKVKRLSVGRDVSIRTALVYSGKISKSVSGSGYFDSLIRVDDLL
ncbi:MAG: AAA family ATPase [Kiritimatiellae bacterium]|nr:AAA family ATPase [Kiritimatiellia bacterium]